MIKLGHKTSVANGADTPTLEGISHRLRFLLLLPENLLPPIC